MKEFLQSILDSSNDRIKSPFVGAYIIAFIVCNWRAILVLALSNHPIEERIVFVNSNYCKVDALLYPLILAIFYVLLLPYINLVIEWLLNSSTKQRKIRKHSNKMFDYQQKKIEVIEEKKLEDIRAGLQDIHSLNNQIEKLKSEKEELLLRIQKDYEISQKTLTETDHHYKQQINTLEKELFRAKRNSESKDPVFAKAMIILDNWSLSEFQLFMEIVDNYVFETDYPLTKDSLKNIDKYLELELLIDDNEKYKLTSVGQMVYESGKFDIHKK